MRIPKRGAKKTELIAFGLVGLIVLVCCSGVIILNTSDNEPNKIPVTPIQTPPVVCASDFVKIGDVCEFVTPSPTSNPYGISSIPPATPQAGPKQPVLTKPPTRPTTTKPKPTPSSTTHATGNVRPGAFCTPSGATGTYNGKLYTCKTSPTDSKLRWRQ